MHNRTAAFSKLKGKTMSHNHYIISGGGFESMYITNLLAGKLPHIYETPLEPYDRVFLVHVGYGQSATSAELQAVESHKSIFEGSVLANYIDYVQVISLKETDMFSSNQRSNCLLFNDAGSGKTPELARRNEKILKTVARWISRRPSLLEYESTLYVGFEPKAQPYEDCTDEFLDKMYYELGSKFLLEAPLLDAFETEEAYLKSLREDKLYGYVWSCWTPKAKLPCGTCNNCLKHKKMWGTKNGFMLKPLKKNKRGTPFFDMTGLPT
jgi:7-cyano-7-deazaguanine synthase in queuosine biosynthesis